MNRKNLNRTARLLAALAAAAALVLPRHTVFAGTFPVSSQDELTAALSSSDDDIDIVLTGDFDLTQTNVVPSGKNVTVTSEGGPFTLTREFSGGPLFEVSDTAALSLQDVTLDGNKGSYSGDPAVYADGTLNIHDGSVVQNSGAAGVAVGSDGVLNMDGGIIRGNDAANGAGVFSYGEVNVSGDALVTGNHATVNGGGIYSTGPVSLSGSASVSGNTADDDGGGLMLDNGADLKISGSAAVTGNTADGVGGGIRLSVGSELDMTGGAVSGNLASHGGGIFSDGDLHISGDSSISSNRAQYGGGIFSYAPVILSGGASVSGNTADTEGGGVSMDGAKLTVSGSAAVTGNTAGSVGGGILLYSNSNLDMSGGSVSGNKAAYGGGAALWDDTSFLSATGGTFSNNTASADGGAVYVVYEALQNVTTGPGVTFSGNRASQAYNRNPADDALYAGHISSTVWTGPLTQGYNNYDIAYTNGDPVQLVEYDPDGGSAVPGEVVLKGDRATEPVPPARPGYSFGGWYTDDALTSPYDFTSQVYEDLLLYAKWIPDPVPPEPAPVPDPVPVPETGDSHLPEFCLMMVLVILSSCALLLLLLKPRGKHNRA